MKKILLSALCMLALFSGCTSKEQDEQAVQGCDDEPICDVTAPADMSAYVGFTEKENQFVLTPMRDMITKINTKGDGIYYIGYATCPWCIQAVPVMNEVAKANSQKIYYIDKKAEASDEASIAELTDLLADILPKKDGKPHLYVPEVVVIKEGQIIANHSGTVGDYDAHERSMTKEEEAELKSIYEEMFAKLK